jgi:hypothetical protein
VCHSGIGVISNYWYAADGGRNNPDNVMPRAYDKIGTNSLENFPGPVAPNVTSWDFDKFKPDLVVLNLGTNDTEYINWNKGIHSAARRTEFKEGYVQFLKNIRAKNPNAKLLCTIGLMSAADIFSLIEQAVADYHAETGESDSTIAAFELPAQNTGGGNIGTDWHPLENSNAAAAKALVTRLETFMGWTKDAEVLDKEEDLIALGRAVYN